MPVELTAKGYIEIYEGDTLVSRHRQEREALERLSELPFGFYTVRYPNVMARVYGVIAPADSGDVIPPSQVTGLTATVTSATTLTLDWDAASDDVGVGAYQIYQDGVPLVSTANLTYGVTGLTPSTQYTYTVAASDSVGNQGPASDPVAPTTDPNAAPVWAGLSSLAYDEGDGVSLSLDAFCADADGDPITYTVEAGSRPGWLTQSGARGQTLSGTAVAGSWAFTLGASDGIAAVSTNPVTVDVVAVDATAPDPPAAPAVTGFTANSITLDIPVSAAGDHSHYRLARSLTGLAGSFGVIDSNVSAGSYLVPNLNADTDYWFALYDEDLAGNVSTIGSSVNQKTDVFETLDVGPRVFQQSPLIPTIYVSPSGGGDGSSAGSPWTLHEANLAVGPDDVVEMAAGDYQTSIFPRVDGQVSARITYQNAPGETPVLTDTYNAVPGSSNRSGSAINIAGRSYITVWGVNADGQNHPSTSMEPDGANPQATGATIGSWVAADDTHWCEIKHCSFIRANGYTAIRFDDTASFNVIEDCYAERVGSSWYAQNGELFEFRDGTHHNICRHNQFRYAGHGVLTVKGDYNVAEYNIIDNRRWDGPGVFDTVNGGGNRLGNLQHVTYGAPYTGGHLLYQYNQILGNWIGGPNNGYSGEALRTDGINVNSNESIVRFNDVQGTYGYSIGSKIITNSPQATQNYIYNNNLHNWNQGNSGTGWQNAIYMSTGSSSDSFLRLTDNVYLNNSISAPAAGSLEHIQWLIRDTTADKRRDDEFDNNRVFNNSFEEASGSVEVVSYDSGTQTLASLEGSRSDIAADNSFGSLVDSTGGDDLTTITSSSNTGLTFRVAEAYGFFPGIPELGMAGDTIVINRTGSSAEIDSIDYTTGDITVKTPVTWVSGNGVSLINMVSGGQIATGIRTSPGSPAVGSPPVWSSVDQSLPEDVFASVDFDNYCTDPDGDSITYTLVSGSQPTGMTFSGAKGEILSGSPTTAAVYPFTMRADDGNNTADQLITLTITAVDTTDPDPPDAPTIDNGATTPNSLTLILPVSAAGDHASFTVLRSDTGLIGSFGVVEAGVTTPTWQDNGLNAGTQYFYALYDVDDSGNTSAIGASVAGTTGQFAGGTDLEALTTTYFVGTGGNDGGNDGRTHANRWATLANCVGLPVSSKVYILTGTNLTVNSYSPNWNGTINDYAVLGSYYMDPGNNGQATSLHEGTQAKQNTKPILTCTQNFTSNDSHWVVSLNGRQYWNIQDIETKLGGFLNYHDAPHVHITGGTSFFNLKRLRARAFDTHAEWDAYLVNQELIYGDAGGTRFEEYLNLGVCNTFLVEDSDYLYSRGKSIFCSQSATIGRFNRGTVMYQNGSSIRISTAGGTNCRHLIENMILGGSWADDGSQVFNAGTDPAAQGRNVVYRNCIIKESQENALDLKGSEDVLVEKCIVYGNVGRNGGFGSSENRNSPGALMTGEASIHAIHRFNLVYDNSTGVRNNSGRITYQNTVVSNARDYTGGNSVLSLGGTSIFNVGITMGAGEGYASNYPVITINNIVMNHRQYEGHSSNTPTGSWHDSNLYYNAAQTPKFYNNDSNGSQQNLTLAQYQSALAANPNDQIGAEANSFVDNPRLVDIPSNPVGDYFDSGWDVSLDTGSPAEGSAIALATVTQNGTSTVIPVSNARLFFAGWTDGDGVEGDYVKIGADVTQITAVSRANNTITVNPAISYTSGDEIYLCASDGTPHNNIGASQPSFTLFDESLLSPPLGETPPGSDPVWTTVDQTLQANAFYNISFDGYCTDPDGGALVYTQISGTKPVGMDFSGTRGEILSGTPTAEAVYTFTMRATDPEGRTADQFITISTTFADITPPPAPDAPVITAYAANYVLLSQPANPDPDHDNYRIQRSLDDTNWGTIRFGWRAEDGDFVDDGVNASTTYYYRLISIDAVPSPNQNISDPGPSVSVTTKAVTEQYNFGTPLDTGFLANSTASNPLCQVSCDVIDAKGGTFEFGDNGYYKYTRGFTGETGVASFRFYQWDEDGAGAFSTAVFSLNVL